MTMRALMANTAVPTYVFSYNLYRADLFGLKLNTIFYSNVIPVY